MTDTLATLQQRYASCLRRLRPHQPASPFHQSVQHRPTHNGDAHVEVVDGWLHYVVTERGCELHRRVACDEDELLYWLLDDVTAAISWRRRPSLLPRLLGRDSRRQRFARQVTLLARVDPAWAARKHRELAGILARDPYRDRR